MIAKEQFILGALTVLALCSTLNHGATTIATKTIASPSSSTYGNGDENGTTTISIAEGRGNETQKEANRSENARSLDFDISKYTSSDFHNKVYDLPTSPEHEKFTNHQLPKAYESYDLTTPNTRNFDERHKSIQNEIQKRLEEDEDDEELEPEEAPRETLPQRNNKTVLNFVRFSNVVSDDDVRNKSSMHRNYETEKGLNLSYESAYNESEIVGENEKAKRAFDGNATDERSEQENLLPAYETSAKTLPEEQAQQENNIAPVLVPLPLTTAPSTMVTTSTEPRTTGMYEITDQDFVSTTEFAYDEVSIHDDANEQFYEMTEHAATNETVEVVNAATTTANVLAANASKLEQVAGNVGSAVTDQMQPIDANTEPTATNTPALSTTSETSTMPLETTTFISAEYTTAHISNEEFNTETETEGYSTATEQSLDISTTEPVSNIETTTEPSITSTEMIDESSTLPIAHSNNSVSNGTVAETTTIMDTTTEVETTTEDPQTTPVIIITTTMIRPTETVSNAIIKEEDFRPLVPTGTNEIKKFNASVPEDLEDFVDEVADDYLEVHRKEKPFQPVVPKGVSEPTKEVPDSNSIPTGILSTEKGITGGQEPQSPGSNEEVTDSESDIDKSSSGTIIAIVLSTVGALCLILLAILLFVMRRRQKRFNYGQRCTPVSLDAYSMDNVSVYNSVRRKPAMRSSKRSYGNPAFDDDGTVAHPLNFHAIIRFANNSDDIRAEFEDIPQVTAKMAELPDGCDTKNRYANVIPLPESRVFLAQYDDDPTSDYINANYVTGPKGARGYYIACQAPMHNTVNDFWRMIWEQQCKVILMLTHLYENGVEKCVDYLPPSEVVDCHRLFGDYQVTLKKREVKDKYIIASLQLKNMVSNSWREVTHLWYSGWPEKGVPEEANSIIAFLIEARSFVKLVQNVETKETGIASSTSLTGRGNQADSSPVVVHCSPGTGRTGTVIACDIAIREFELRRVVDIPRIVYRIRRDRASSVQTKDQYNFIYKVISLYATKLTGGALDSI